MSFDISNVMGWVLRFAWLLLVFQWIDIILQSLTLRKRLIPGGAGIGNRAQAADLVAGITGKSRIERRAASLLDSYSRGWDTKGVIELLAHQNARETYRLCAMGLFVILVLAACVKQSDQPGLAWIGIAALGATLFAKGLVLSGTDAALEEQIISKLQDSPAGGSGASAADIAKALGPAIENAFKTNVPEPGKFAAAISSAIEATKKTLDGSAGQTASTIATALDAARKSIDASASQLSSGFGGGADKIQSALAGHLQQFEKASNASAEQSKAALSAHADKLAKVSQDLSASLDKIASLGKDIEKVLHVQQSVEGAMKSVSASEEFKKTLAALQTHLAASDELVKQASRPRKIRLVEGE